MASPALLTGGMLPLDNTHSSNPADMLKLSELRVSEDSSISDENQDFTDGEMMEQHSPVFLADSKDEECSHSAGFDVTTKDEDGHFVTNVDRDNDTANKLDLQEGDRLVGLNGANLEEWPHELVLLCLRYMFEPVSSGQLEIILVIERSVPEEDGQVYSDSLLELRATVELLPRGDSAISLSVNVVRGVSRPLQLVSDVQFLEKTKCYIRCQDRQKYLKAKKKGHVIASTLTNFRDKSFQFIRYKYRSYQVRGDSADPVYIAVFKHVKTRACINTVSSAKVRTTRTMRTRLRNTRKPDTRFFLLKESDSKHYFMESLVFNDLYLCHDDTRIKLRKQRDMFFASAYPDIQFDIVTKEMLDSERR